MRSRFIYFSENIHLGSKSSDWLYRKRLRHLQVECDYQKMQGPAVMDALEPPPPAAWRDCYLPVFYVHFCNFTHFLNHLKVPFPGLCQWPSANLPTPLENIDFPRLRVLTGFTLPRLGFSYPAALFFSSAPPPPPPRPLSYPAPLLNVA